MSAAAAAAMATPGRLPPLRETLELVEGPVSFDGSPTWLLHDPVSGRFVKIGWMQFEFLSRWSLGTPDTVAAAVREATTLDVAVGDVEHFALQLGHSEFLRPSSPGQVQQLVRKASAAAPKNLVAVLVKNYIFFKVPLFVPGRGYARAAKASAFIAARVFFAATVLAGLIGILLTLRQWDVFVNSFPYLATSGGLLFSVLAVILLKTAHELAHGFVAVNAGCRVRSVGIAFMFFAPLLYTDASDAWRLSDKRKRLLISAAGIISDLSVACWALLLWNFVPAGVFRDMLFVWASTSSLITLLINANPFMRFDGYYMLSDWLDQPNLQPVSFALGRWRLRKLLLGGHAPPPFAMPDRRRRLLILYAYGAWKYRLLLFAGIAYAIFHLMPKVIGIPLAAFEIVYFILLPVWREGSAILAEFRKQALTLRPLISCALCAVLLALLLVPWQGTVGGYGLAGAEHRVILSAAEAGQLVKKSGRVGENVAKGELLFRIASPGREQEVARLTAEIAAAASQMDSLTLSAEDIGRAEVLKLQLRTLNAQLMSARAVLDQLDVRSPIGGTIVETPEPLAEGDWLERGEPLAMIADTETVSVEALIGESELERVRPGASAEVIPFNPDRPRFRAIVTRIDVNSLRTLPDPVLSSTYGGPIPARTGEDKSIVPENPVYRVVLTPVEGVDVTRMELVRVEIAGDSRSLLSRAWRYAAGVVIRESGF